jgi:hypothetical protein
MSFDIFLIPSTASPPPAVLDRQAEVAARAAGAVFPPRDLAHTPDGLRFEMDGGAWHVSDLTPGLCKIVFTAAQQTNAFVTAGGALMRVKGARGRLPGKYDEPIRFVATYQALCDGLEPDLREWQGYARYVHRRFNP